MASKLSLEPQTVSKDVWYYEERKGICVVHRSGAHMYVPWEMVARSVDRWRRDKARRKARKS